MKISRLAASVLLLCFAGLAGAQTHPAKPYALTDLGQTLGLRFWLD